MVFSRLARSGFDMNSLHYQAVKGLRLNLF
jgi:hypothetical protein